VNVLVVGGTRFVGAQLVWRLVAGGHQVTLFNRGRLPDRFGGRVERLRGDRNTDAFAAQLRARRFDAAVDFAAYTGADARQVVDVLGGRVGHYVFISSGQTYLVREGCPRPAREVDYDGPLMPRPADPADTGEWDYGIGKRDAEDVLAAAWRDTRFPATRLRLPMVNGEGDYYRRIESYLWRILDGGPLLLPDGGDTPTRHVYSGAVVRAIAGLLGDPRTFGQAYNMAQDETPTLREILTHLADALGAPPRLVAVPRERLVQEGLDPHGISPFSGRWMSFIDPGRAREELGFRHEGLRTYLDRIVASFLAHPPEAPPEGYRTRAVERSVAAATH
jgi:nucleoside-diphosphate-sugar epimerase